MQLTTDSLYNFLSFRGIQLPFADMWWLVPVSLKIKIFMWLLFKNKVLTKDVLTTKDGKEISNVSFVTVQ